MLSIKPAACRVQHLLRSFGKCEKLPWVLGDFGQLLPPSFGPRNDGCSLFFFLSQVSWVDGTYTLHPENQRNLFLCVRAPIYRTSLEIVEWSQYSVVCAYIICF